MGPKTGATFVGLTTKVNDGIWRRKQAKKCPQSVCKVYAKRMAPVWHRVRVKVLTQHPDFTQHRGFLPVYEESFDIT